MKEKVLYLILGILIGAVITSGCFLLLNKNNGAPQGMGGNMPDFSNMSDEEKEEMMKNRPDGAPGEMPNGKPGDKNQTQDSTSDTTGTSQTEDISSNS